MHSWTPLTDSIYTYSIRMYSIRMYSIRMYSIRMYSIRMYSIHMYSIRMYTVFHALLAMHIISLRPAIFHLLSLALHIRTYVNWIVLYCLIAKWVPWYLLNQNCCPSLKTGMEPPNPTTNRSGFSLSTLLCTLLGCWFERLRGESSSWPGKKERGSCCGTHKNNVNKRRILVPLKKHTLCAQCQCTHTVTDTGQWVLCAADQHSLHCQLLL